MAAETSALPLSACKLLTGTFLADRATVQALLPPGYTPTEVRTQGTSVPDRTMVEAHLLDCAGDGVSGAGRILMLVAGVVPPVGVTALVEGSNHVVLGSAHGQAATLEAFASWSLGPAAVIDLPAVGREASGSGRTSVDAAGLRLEAATQHDPAGYATALAMRLFAIQDGSTIGAVDLLRPEADTLDVGTALLAGEQFVGVPVPAAGPGPAGIGHIPRVTLAWTPLANLTAAAAPPAG